MLARLSLCRERGVTRAGVRFGSDLEDLLHVLISAGEDLAVHFVGGVVLALENPPARRKEGLFFVVLPFLQVGVIRVQYLGDFVFGGLFPLIC